MFHNIRRLAASILLFVAPLVAVPALAVANSGYRTIQSVPAGGGVVKILEDARLTRALAGKMWGVAVDPEFVLGENDPAAQTFKTKPLLPAKLRQMGPGGKVLEDTVFATPLARIETRRLGRAGAAIYLITTDDDVGFGSYSGRATELYAIHDRRLETLLATDETGNAQPIKLIDTLKSGWKIMDAKPTHTVIQQLLCRPNFKTSDDFELTYITYQFDGHTWRSAHRTAPGMWEDDEDWPAASNFPHATGR